MDPSTDTSWICPRCASEVPWDFAVCWSCGTSPEGKVDPDFKTLAEDDRTNPHEPVYEPFQFSLMSLLWVTAGVAALFAVVRLWSPAVDKYFRGIVNASLLAVGGGALCLVVYRAARKRLQRPGQALLDAAIVLLLTMVVLNLIGAILEW